MKNRLLVLLLGCLTLATAQARLGDTRRELKDRLGKVANEPAKNTSIWFVETRGGTLSYTVTFDRKGRSIAETLKPVQLADFSNQSAEGFINLQLEPYRHSRTMQVVKPGETYHFGGKEFVCSPAQWVAVDEDNDILIVWTRGGGLPSVMAVRREMME